MKIKYMMYLSLTVLSYCSWAQYKHVQFDQNRVQYKSFDWLYYGNETYDVHFYNGGELYAKMALAELESDFEDITDLIGYSPFAKAQIFVYNNYPDLLQSNVGVGQPTFTIAGETKFVKLMTEAYYPGSVVEFRRELKYKTTKMLLEDMMFGGTLGEVFQNSYLLHLSNWFTEGATRYVAYGWDMEMDDYVRDYIQHNKIKHFKKLEGEEAAIIGQSVWNYIAVRYGRSNLSNILNLTRIIRNEDLSVASSLGISFEKFIFEWAKYYGASQESINDSYIEPSKEERLVRTFNPENKLTRVRLSPDGTKLAYVQHSLGKYKIVIKDLENDRENIAHRGGYTIIDQEISYDLPLIAWANDYELGIVEYDADESFLITFNLNKGSKTKKSLFRFNQVNDISYNDNGKLAVISADVEGNTDLFLLSTRKNAIRRLTKDQWDDLHPTFIPGTNSIVFSSNRSTDSLSVRPESTSDPQDHLNLFVYNLDTTRAVLHRLTKTYSNDLYPMAIDIDNVFYLSDLKGINNLYRYTFSSDSYTQVTNFRTSLQSYDINQYTRDMCFLMLTESQKKIYLKRNYDLNASIFPPQTLRHQVRQLEYVRSQREQRNEKDLFDELGAERSLFEQIDSLVGNPNDPDALSLSYESTQNELSSALDSLPSEEGFINLGSYTFDSIDEGLMNDIRSEPAQLITGPDPLDFLFENGRIRRDSVTRDTIAVVYHDDGFINLNDYQFETTLPGYYANDKEIVSPYYNPAEARLDSVEARPTDPTMSPDNFQFEEEVPDSDDFSFLSIYLKMQEEPEIVGPLPFVTSFSIDNVVSSAVFDQLRGFGVLLETQMSDLLNNHRFSGGMMFITDLQSGDFYAQYEYLKHRLDYHARYDRRVMLKQGSEPNLNSDFQFFIQKYKMNTYSVGASLPTTVATRFEADVFMRFTEAINLNPDVIGENYSNANTVFVGSSHDFGGYRVSWVFDNAISHGLNLFEGTKAKVSYEHNEGYTDSNRSFNKFSADLRRYQKIHRELVLAGRVYFAQSMGARPMTYMLGGIDNWAFSKSDNTDNLSTPLSFSNHKDNTDVLFAEFVNLRGFDFNRFSGTHVLTASAELRWPVVVYFSSGAIKSDFLRNLQLISFYDIGSAWTGRSPFQTGNTIDTREINSAAFKATVRATRNPWLSSYGFGLRTSLLGYYTRFDLAKPIEDFDLGKLRFYFSIGYDF